MMKEERTNPDREAFVKEFTSMWPGWEKYITCGIECIENGTIGSIESPGYYKIERAGKSIKAKLFAGKETRSYKWPIGE